MIKTIAYKEFLQMVMPRYVNRLQFYEGKEPLFHKYDLEEEIIWEEDL